MQAIDAAETGTVVALGDALAEPEADADAETELDGAAAGVPTKNQLAATAAPRPASAVKLATSNPIRLKVDAVMLPK